MRLIGRILITVLAIIGSVTLSLFLVGLYVALEERPESLPDRMVLTLDLDRGVVEAAADNPFARFGSRRAYGVRDVVEALDMAARDDRVVGVLAHVRSAGLGMARAQEVRDAILDFRKSGKPAILFSESIGEFGAGTVEYYVASAFAQVWLQPSGDVSITGFLLENPFAREALDDLRIKPQFAARHEYKSAIDILTETGFSKENRQALDGLLTSWYEQAVGGIADARGLPPEKVRGLIDRAPLLAQEALDGGLVDRLAYRDEVDAFIKPAGAEYVDLAAYAERAGSPHLKGTRIALVYGVGEVRSGDGKANPLAGGAVMAADRVAKALEEAIDDPKVKAIVFRVDSPGGSYVASDRVWRQVGRARAAGKPVVVSMGDIAASGGYFVSMAANRIIAQPGTITGSIGVFSGKLVLGDFWRKLGVNWDELHRGGNAPMWSSNYEFSPAAWQRIDALLDRIYQDFTTKAAAGRNLPVEALDEVARGRIWSGSAAKRAGLVDDLGGLTTAFRHARELAGLPPDAPIEIRRLPEPRSPYAFLVEALADGDAPLGLSVDRDLATLVDAARPLARHLRALDATAGELRTPWFGN